MSAERIADRLQADIVAGSYRPGTELKQGEIAERFDVSRIPVRDALQLLAARGLIDLVPNRRARVISLSVDEICEIYDLRILLECDCLQQAIAMMDQDDLNTVSTALEHSSIDAKTARWADGDWEFHKTLYRPAKKPRQLRMIEDLRRTCRIHIAGYGLLPDRTSDWLQDHADLVDACANRASEKAVTILKHHIEAAGQTLTGALSDGILP
ncbi:GntR family transcriptional regulator [Roseibium sp.]|uniref:GntR family transcriptional regulator n=1 Tax=Roseibium sp. TaxID=1936156 RepID=UPI003B51BBFF